MTDTTANGAAPGPLSPAPRRYKVKLGRVAMLYGEMISPSHAGIEVDEAGLAALGDAVVQKTELLPNGL